MIFNFISLNVGFVTLALLAYGILQWLHIPVGGFLDWLTALAMIEWILAVVTIPWNVHFAAKEVVVEADQSTNRQIPVDAKQTEYAQRVAQISFWVAIALHLLSAAALYVLAVTGITTLGYFGSVAALLLTALRPAFRAYDYLVARLATIRETVKYPRADIVELRSRLETLEVTAKQLEQQLNPEEPQSWVAIFQRELSANQQQTISLNAQLQEFQATNQAEHSRLSQEARSAIAQLTADSQFLEQVREIIRFFKTA